jgi:hypothetical protein
MANIHMRATSYRARKTDTDRYLVPLNPLFIYLGSRTHDHLFGLAERCDDLVRNTKDRADDFRRRKCEPLNLR